MSKLLTSLVDSRNDIVRLAWLSISFTPRRITVITVQAERAQMKKNSTGEREKKYKIDKTENRVRAVTVYLTSM